MWKRLENIAIWTSAILFIILLILIFVILGGNEMVIRTELTKMQIARNGLIAFSSFIGLAIILIWMFA